MAHQCSLREANRMAGAAASRALNLARPSQPRRLCSSVSKKSLSSPEPPAPAATSTSAPGAVQPQAITGVLLAEQRALAAARSKEEGSEGGGASLGKPQWTPSQAFQGSATTLHRAGRAGRAASTPRVAPEAVPEAKPPGLRRRGLLGSSAPEFKASKPAPRAARRVQVPTMAEGGSSSVVASSATKRFRERRQLEIRAAAGDAAAIEILGKTTVSESNAQRTGGGSSRGGAGLGDGGGGGLFTLSAVLVVVASAGYYFLDDLAPLKALSSSVLGEEGDQSGKVDSSASLRHTTPPLDAAAGATTSATHHDAVAAAAATDASGESGTSSTSRKTGANPAGWQDNDTAAIAGRPGSSPTVAINEIADEDDDAIGGSDSPAPGYMQWLVRLLGRHHEDRDSNGSGERNGL